MKIIFNSEDCRTIIWGVERALAEAKVISKKECERILDEEDEEHCERMKKADEALAKRLEKAFGSLESTDVDLADACS